MSKNLRDPCCSWAKYSR